MRGGYSTSEETTDVLSNPVRSWLLSDQNRKKKLAYATSSAHKEITQGFRVKHDNVVTDLTNHVREYFNPFIDTPAGNFKTGVEIEPEVIKGLLN